MCDIARQFLRKGNLPQSGPQIGGESLYAFWDDAFQHFLSIGESFLRRNRPEATPAMHFSQQVIRCHIKVLYRVVKSDRQSREQLLNRLKPDL